MPILRLRPYVRTAQDRPVGLVLSPTKVIGEWTGTRWKNVPRKAALYCNAARTMRPLYERGECEAVYWKKSARIRSLTGWKWWHPTTNDPHTVYFLRETLNRIPEAERFGALLEFVSFIRAAGGSPGSPVGMLNSLMRVSLSESFTESSINVPTDYIWRGSRVQQADRMAREYGFTDLWDIRAAFPSALANAYVPRRWRHYPAGVDSDLPDAPAGYARAIVYVPWFMHGPIPNVSAHRPDFPTEGFVRGIWSFDELRAAEAVGCELYILEFWTGSMFRQPFKEWGRMVRELRAAVGRDAERLVKMAANRYVGKFAMDGHRERSRYVKGTEKWIIERGHKRPESITVHGLVTANVRAELFTNGIHPYPAHFIFCHTDGVALQADEYTTEMRPPDDRWAIKAEMERLLLINPQRYAYVAAPPDIEPGNWRYVVAGIPQEVASDFFDDRWLRTDDRSGADSILGRGKRNGKTGNARGARNTRTPANANGRKRSWTTARHSG